jgi:hypothetical protein
LGGDPSPRIPCIAGRRSAFASAGAARATTWHDGDPVTYDQTTWATDGSDANRLLLDEFPTV